MRDHTKLKAFVMADALALEVYCATRRFPAEERFGLASQMRRSAVSVPSNIVEGCARHTESDFLHFLDMAYGSACELEYQISLSYRLGYLNEESYNAIHPKSTETTKIINGLICSFRQKPED